MGQCPPDWADGGEVWTKPSLYTHGEIESLGVACEGPFGTSMPWVCIEFYARVVRCI